MVSAKVPSLATLGAARSDNRQVVPGAPVLEELVAKEIRAKLPVS